MVDKIIIENLSLQYSDGTESLRDVSMGIRQNAVTVLFGPAEVGNPLCCAVLIASMI
jgi:phosphate transport system ATP-binding protein